MAFALSRRSRLTPIQNQVGGLASRILDIARGRSFSTLPVCLRSFPGSVPSFGQPAPCDTRAENSVPPLRLSSFFFAIWQESPGHKSPPLVTTRARYRYSPDCSDLWHVFNNGCHEENHRRGQSCAYFLSA